MRVDFQKMLAMARRLQLPLRVLPVLILLSIVWVVFEGIVVALLLPIFELLREGGIVENAKLEGWHWDKIREIAGYFGVPVSLGLLLLTSFFFLLLRQIFNFFNVYFHGHTLRRTADSIRRRAFQLLLFTRSDVQDELRPGEVANELSIELNRALSCIFSTVRAVGTVFQMTIYLGGLFALSMPMTILSIGVFAIFGFLSRNILVAIKDTGMAISNANTELTSFLVDRLQRARLIRLSTTERAESKAYTVLSQREADQQLRQKMLAMRITLLPEPIAVGFGYTILFVGSRYFGMSLEILCLFVVVLIRLMPIVKQLSNEYNKIVGQWASVLKVDRRIASLEGAKEGRGGEKTFTALDSGIAYQNVSLNYSSDRSPALSNVSVTIPAHKMTALVGPSGAGKSTFVDLLPRLRDPTVGSISFDDTPIEEFSMSSLRSGIAFVPQQPQLFDISVAEHIRYGKEDATDEEVVRAAKLAGAFDFIEQLPDGFDTLLGDGGNRLSGGQRQRLDIARALVRRAPILILDEPTSALDADAEAAFRDALATLRSETELTIIVIAHRLSTIADAEQIIVIKNGKIEAVGSHSELVSGRNWYASAYTEQIGSRQRQAKNNLREPAAES